MIKPAILALLACTMLPLMAHAAAVTPLAASDIPALTKPPTHGERIIALWSLDCVYCEANLKALARVQQRHPREVELILVATDNPSREQAVVEHLQKIGMIGFRAQYYAEASPERLNFLLDPEWGGELPRTLVIRADGSRSGISGGLSPSQLGRIGSP